MPLIARKSSLSLPEELADVDTWVPRKEEGCRLQSALEGGRDDSRRPRVPLTELGEVIDRRLCGERFCLACSRKFRVHQPRILQNGLPRIFQNRYMLGTSAHVTIGLRPHSSRRRGFFLLDVVNGLTMSDEVHDFSHTRGLDACAAFKHGVGFLHLCARSRRCFHIAFGICKAHREDENRIFGTMATSEYQEFGKTKRTT
mmetsp:Transcript_87971/g.247183  ORF Transcript_87971/g.247183 Transcript_87971/m.247183 type:complete len:200 (-) Transcript_87971:4-603(-)